MAKTRKKNSIRRHQKVQRRRRLATILVVFLSCSFVWGGLFFLSQLGPGKVDWTSTKDALGSESRAQPLAGKYENLSAEELKAISLRLEAEAETLANEGEYESASLKYTEAFELQYSLNRSYPLSLLYDASRVIRLRLEANNSLAEPLFLRSLDLEQQADSLAKGGELDVAIKVLSEAVAFQQQINYEYRDTHRKSILRLEQLKTKLAEFESRGVHLELRELLEQAASLEASGASEEAGVYFEKAAFLQQQVNETFPNSPYASITRLNELQKKRQVAQSAVFAEALKEKINQLDQLLAKRDIDAAVQLISELRQSLREFETAYPLSAVIDEPLKARVDYLNQQKAHLGIIQEKVYDALVSLTGPGDAYMLCTEVPQSLYLALIGSNPSRNKADSKPVDSVNWLEAKEFCRRLSWILGKEVRLPTEEIFRKALGTISTLNAEASIWSAEDVDGHSQPVGQKEPFPGGFFDLLGNVSEWLESSDSNTSEVVQHIGGHAQDSIETILNVPVRKSPRAARNRLIGFRVIVLNER